MPRLRFLAFLTAIWIAHPIAGAISQTNGVGAPGAGISAPRIGEPGIGLTEDHRRTIYREVGSEPARAIPEGSPATIGAEIPDSVMLNEMPVSVKDQIGVLRDFKFAKLNDETIVIVDPAKRTIVDVVTKPEGTR
jgi:hypothetical protein